ncbi:unnamed protein product [Amoebophrya sp. A25]|nr:unnamed protein product [Amoebophrya sp. A25]|eukprot:GSA25T00019965001.1
MMFPSPAALEASREKAVLGGEDEQLHRYQEDSGRPSRLSVAEETVVTDHQARQLYHMVQKAEGVIAPGAWYTSVLFFRAFYARRSILEHNPETSLFCALLLALKAEEQALDVSFFANLLGKILGAPTPASSSSASDASVTVPHPGPEDRAATKRKIEKRWADVLRSELDFIEGIDFQLVVEKPFAILELLAETLVAEQGPPSSEAFGEEKNHYIHQEVDAVSLVKPWTSEQVRAAAMSDEALCLPVRLIAIAIFVAAGNRVPASVKRSLSAEEVQLMKPLILKVRAAEGATTSAEQAAQLGTILNKRKQCLKQRKAK